MNEDVIVLLLGASEGAYALAASFAEYGVPAVLMDEEIPEIFEASALFAEIRRVPGMEYRGLLLRALSDFYEKYAGKSLLLLPTTEAYATRLLAEREALERMYLLPQKLSSKLSSKPFSFDGAVAGVLLAYVGGTGKCRTIYGRVVASTDAGEPIAVITEPKPIWVQAPPAPEAQGFLLYAVSEKGECYPYENGGALSPLIAFPSASDTSVAEWILNDSVLCEKTEEADTASAVFSLLSYRRLKPFLHPDSEEEVRALRRSRLFLSLYPSRSERKGLFFRRALTHFALQNRQKTAKRKK